MKNRLILTSMMTIFCYSAIAQTYSKKITYGLRAGIDYQNFNGNAYNGYTFYNNRVPRFHTGVVVGIPVAHNFQLQTGLLYSTKGSKAMKRFGHDSGFDPLIKYNLTYIELPANFFYRPALGNGHLLLGFGPYVGYAIAGNVKYYYAVGSSLIERDIEFTKDGIPQNRETQFNRFDYGGNLILGYELAKGLTIQINAQLGMAQINTSNIHGISFRNSGFGLSLGYNLQCFSSKI